MNRNILKTIQKALLRLGYEPGPIDGICGPKTRQAIVAYKLEAGFSPTPQLNTVITQQLLNKAMRIQTSEPLWLAHAKTYIGLRETKGEKHTSKIVDFFKSIGSAIRNDESPWCAAFVGGVLEEIGLGSSRKASARSYLKWGESLPGPAVGAIVVFWRGSPLGWSGHVGFIVGKNQDGNLFVLGGNQGNEVNVKPFKKDRVLGYRWPYEKTKPVTGFSELPVISNTNSISTNEV